MKLKYNQDHISLKYFNDVELDNFSVITGKNGSGKTHFLEAINLGKIIIEGVDKSEIVYYNYNDFSVFEGKVQSDAKKNLRKSNWTNESNQLVQKITQIKRVAFQNAINENGNKPLENFIYSQALQPNFDFDGQYGNSSDYDTLEEFNREETKDLAKFEKKFTSPFYQLMLQWMQQNKELSSITKDILKESFQEAREKMSSKFEEENKELFDSLSGSANYGKLFSFNQNDIENPDFFLEDIANEEKEYQFTKTLNSLNRLSSEEWEEDISYLNKEEFIKIHGKSPVEQINDVLKEYDCNGYFLSTNRFQAQIGVDKLNIKVNITLQHQEKGYQTRFEQLSSGEKTLIALSLLIYKTRKNKIVPRMLLLDEVDSSLHPSMIKRLLNVIQEHFIVNLKMKVILATHSPTTVALAPKKAIYAVESIGDEKIKKVDIQIAVNILTEGFATLNIDESNLGIEYNINRTNLPVVFTEGITDKILLEIAWQKLYDCDMPFFIQDCFDASFLANLFKRGYDAKDGIFINHHDKILIALFDFDEEGYNSWNSIIKLDEPVEKNPRLGITFQNNEKNAFKLLLPVPNNDIEKQVIKSGNETFKNSSIFPIELLFYGVESVKGYFNKKVVTGGSEIIEFIGKKRKFAKQSEELNKEDFNNFIPLFEQLKSITNTQ